MNKCPYCNRNFTSEYGLKTHLKFCKSKPEEETLENIITDESKIESDIISLNKVESLPEVKKTIPDERYEGLIDEEIKWLNNFIIGFKFCGQITDKDMPNLEKIYLLKINKKLPGSRDCKYCRINMGVAVSNYYK